MIFGRRGSSKIRHDSISLDFYFLEKLAESIFFIFVVFNQIRSVIRFN